MKIGQTVYLRPVEMGNAYRRDKSIKEATVEKVGRKYVTIVRYGQFDIESRMQKTIYRSDYELFESKEELDLKMEAEDLSNRIKNSIHKYGKWNLDIDKPTDDVLNKFDAVASIRMNILRRQRDALLAETDYMALGDVTLSDAWKTYRQALRDITDTTPSDDALSNITFPTKPS